MKKLLLIRLSSLGDILLTTPVLASLREKYPDAQIDIVMSSEYGPLSPLLPGRPRVHLFNKAEGLVGLLHLRRELAHEHYDAVLDLHNNLRSRLLRRGLSRRSYVIRKRTMKRWLLVRYKINLLKDEPDVIGRYFETAAELGIADTGDGAMLTVPESGTDRAVALVPGARHRTKRWPLEYYQEIGKQLAAQGYTIRLLGSASERELCESLCEKIGRGVCNNMAGELSLSATAIALSKCEFAVTNDSGLMHLATAVGTPTFAIFGPTVRAFGFAPRHNVTIIENADLYCRPCTAHGSDKCPEGHFRCMLELDPESVAISIDEAL